MRRPVHLLAVALLCCCAVSFALVAEEATSTQGIWEALKTQLRDVSSVPGATERVQGLLEQLNNRLRAEQMLADAHYQSVTTFYYERIANLTESSRNHSVAMDNVKRRAQNVSFAKEQYQVHLSTLDSRIRTLADKIGKFEDKITAGESVRKEENLRFQKRESETKEQILATNHMVDRIGTPSKPKPASFASTLNRAIKSKTSFLELEMTTEAGVEVEATMPSDYEELKDLASTLFDNLHSFLRKIKVEEANRSYRWSIQKFAFQNKSAELQARINALEATRIPTQKALNNSNFELQSLPATLHLEKQKQDRDEKALRRMKETLQGVIDDNNTQTAERNQQLQTAEKMYQEVLKHLGDTPAKPTPQSLAADSKPIFAGKDHLGLAVPANVPSPTK